MMSWKERIRIYKWFWLACAGLGWSIGWALSPLFLDKPFFVWYTGFKLCIVVGYVYLFLITSARASDDIFDHYEKLRNEKP